MHLVLDSAAGIIAQAKPSGSAARKGSITSDPEGAVGPTFGAGSGFCGGSGCYMGSLAGCCTETGGCSGTSVTLTADAWVCSSSGVDEGAGGPSRSGQ